MKTTVSEDALKMQKEIQKQIKNGKREYIFELTRRNKTYPHYPVSETISGFSEVKDPHTGGQRAIMYAAGNSTIFVDLMDEVEKKKTPEPIKFTHGIKVVSSDEVNLLSFMLLCAYNENSEFGINGNKIFKERDFEKEALVHIAQKELVLDAELKVRRMDSDDARAYFFALNNGRFTIAQIERFSVLEIKNQMYDIAKREPNKVMNVLNDKSIRARYWLSRGIIEGKVIYDESNENLRFAGEDQPFFNSVGQNVITFFCDSAGRNKVVDEIVDEIETIISPVAPTEKNDNPNIKDTFYHEVIEGALAFSKPALTVDENGVYKFRLVGNKHMDFDSREEVINHMKESNKFLGSLIAHS